MADTTVTISNLPADWDLELWQGDPFDLSLGWEADDVLVNTAGWTAELVVAGVEAGSFTSGNGRVVLGGSTYNVVVHLTKDDTADLPTGGRKYSLVLTSGAGVPKTILAGTLDVSNEE